MRSSARCCAWNLRQEHQQAICCRTLGCKNVSNMVRTLIVCRGSIALPIYRELDVCEFIHLGSSSYLPRRPESSPAPVSATTLCRKSREVTNLSAHEASIHCVFDCLGDILSLTNAADKMLSVMQLAVVARPDLRPRSPRVVLMWCTLSR